MRGRLREVEGDGGWGAVELILRVLDVEQADAHDGRYRALDR